MKHDNYCNMVFSQEMTWRPEHVINKHCSGWFCAIDFIAAARLGFWTNQTRKILMNVTN
jgi:hypothetical protein